MPRHLFLRCINAASVSLPSLRTGPICHSRHPFLDVTAMISTVCISVRRALCSRGGVLTQR